MTPVYVHAETQDGRMTFFFDVPEESPTVRGYAALMGEGLRGQRPSKCWAFRAISTSTWGWIRCCRTSG